MSNELEQAMRILGFVPAPLEDFPEASRQKIQALLDWKAQAVLEAKAEELFRLTDPGAFARYGDGAIAYFGGSAFVSVESILKRLAELREKSE